MSLAGDPTARTSSVPAFGRRAPRAVVRLGGDIAPVGANRRDHQRAAGEIVLSTENFSAVLAQHTR
jgi:hypothetical protein